MVNDEDIRSYLKNVATDMTAEVARRLERGVESGESPTDFP
jgi:hypothetical protein